HAEVLDAVKEEADVVALLRAALSGGDGGTRALRVLRLERELVVVADEVLFLLDFVDEGKLRELRLGQSPAGVPSLEDRDGEIVCSGHLEASRVGGWTWRAPS